MWAFPQISRNLPLGPLLSSSSSVVVCCCESVAVFALCLPLLLPWCLGVPHACTHMHGGAPCMYTHACMQACMHTHMHTCINMIISCQMAAPMGVISFPREFPLWHYHTWMCAHAWDTPHTPWQTPTPIHPPPPEGGTPEISQKSIKIEQIEIF